MDATSRALYTIEQVRLCEKIATQESSISADDLMLKAGQAAFNIVKINFPDVKKITVFCGYGNNAGDGYVIACLAHQQGYAVSVYYLKEIEELPAIARQAAIIALASGVSIQPFDDTLELDTELHIDALLGIGIKGAVLPPLEECINYLNESHIPILALDVPSGLNANTGEVLGVAIQATITVSFIANKVGLFTLDGPDHSGKVMVDDLGLKDYLRIISPNVYELTHSSMKSSLLPRKKNSFKGMYGHVLIVGGGIGMPGAPQLAAAAALRVGAGLVTIATASEYAKQLCVGLPEAMIYGVDTKEDLEPLLQKATVCVIGPGLGINAWANSLFSLVLASQLPLVIDASALHLLAKNSQKDDNWVLTPHPGEAAVLLGVDVKIIQQDRLTAALEIQRKFGGSVALKGAGTVINIGKESYLCTRGNPGMATAGTGDVLSGVIAGLIAQGLSLQEALKLGVFVHAQAGDNAAREKGERGLIASDLISFLQQQINEFH
jgi:hydroxyethylthiazole kinase-like uncharacterized protein yjeF